MSELISKKQAAKAFIDGEDVEFMDQTGQWRTILDNTVLKVFLDRTHFRLKPRTITINGVDVGQPQSCDWNFNDPNDVVLKFKSREDALHFHENILKIFSPIK